MTYHRAADTIAKTQKPVPPLRKISKETALAMSGGSLAKRFINIVGETKPMNPARAQRLNNVASIPTKTLNNLRQSK